MFISVLPMGTERVVCHSDSVLNGNFTFSGLGVQVDHSGLTQIDLNEGDEKMSIRAGTLVCKWFSLPDNTHIYHLR